MSLRVNLRGTRKFVSRTFLLLSKSYIENVITYYVYILECADRSFYTGITSNLTQRLESHQSGKYKDSYTSKRRPVNLVYYCEFTDPNLAIETEKRIKKWSKAKKKALIAGEYEKLPNLAKKKFR